MKTDDGGTWSDGAIAKGLCEVPESEPAALQTYLVPTAKMARPRSYGLPVRMWRITWPTSCHTSRQMFVENSSPPSLTLADRAPIRAGSAHHDRRPEDQISEAIGQQIA
jgi:hypothetical protein